MYVELMGMKPHMRRISTSGSKNSTFSQFPSICMYHSTSKKSQVNSNILKSFCNKHISFFSSSFLYSLAVDSALLDVKTSLISEGTDTNPIMALILKPAYRADTE